MYKRLNDKQKQWILSLSGKDLYSKAHDLKNKNKIDTETMIEMFSFWLNEHNLRHDTAYIYNKSTGKFTENIGEPKLFWEQFDDEISIQTIKNEFQVAWNKNKTSLIKDALEVFS